MDHIKVLFFPQRWFLFIYKILYLSTMHHCSTQHYTIVTMQQCCTIASTTSFKASSLGHDWVNEVHLNINLPRTYHSLLFLPVRQHQTAASLFSQTIISASAHLSSLVSLSASSFSLSPLLAHLSLRPLPWLCAARKALFGYKKLAVTFHSS